MMRQVTRLNHAFITLALSVFSWSGMAMIPAPEAADFCPAKTDYSPGVSCSSGMVIARSQRDLDSYRINFGLSDGKYRNLRINFPLTGENAVVIHSPCRIATGGGLTHTARHICLDAKGAMTVSKNSVFTTQKLHVRSGDNIIFGRSSNIAAGEMAVWAGGKVAVNAGVRLVVTRGLQVESTNAPGTRNFAATIRFAAGSEARAGQIDLTARREIIFSGATLVSSGSFNVTSRGTAVANQIILYNNSSLKALELTVNGGNFFHATGGVSLMATGNLHIAANACDIATTVTLSGGSFSGPCLSTSNVNLAPKVAVVATPNSGIIPFIVSLSATATDPDGTIASYQWLFPDGTTATGATASLSITTPGVHVVGLTVTDNDNAQAMAQVTLTGRQPNMSPTASFSYLPQTGNAPLTVSFDGSSSSDPDGTIASYQWLFSDGERLSGETVQRIFNMAGTYRVALKVTDNAGLSHQTEEFSITVLEPNLPPVMVGNQSFSGSQNLPLSFTLNGATDQEGDTLTYTLVNTPASGALTDCLGGTSDLDCLLTPGPDFTGKVVFSYRANDGKRDSLGTSVVTLTIAPGNRLPVANGGADLQAKVGKVLVLDGSASTDPEGAELSYFWQLTTRPPGSQAVLGRHRSSAPSLIADKNGRYVLRLMVSDGVLNSPFDSVTVTATGGSNVAPVLNAIAATHSLQLGQELRLTLTGSDSDGDSLSFLALNLPPNAKLDAETGKFRFKPGLKQVGNYVVSFMASDDRTVSPIQQVTFSVTAAAMAQETTLKSRVLDGNAYSLGQTTPLVGVTISAPAPAGSTPATITTTSDVNGYFTLTGIAPGPQIVSLDAAGVVATDGSRFANFKGRLPIMPGVLNRPYQDYLLPKIDPRGEATVNPMSATNINNTNIGVSFSVPAQTVMQGDVPYAGKLSVSEVPNNATPRELPEVLRPNFIITLQPVGLTFATPVRVNFPNRDNLPPGATTELYSLSERGGFKRVGIGRVTRDGLSIALIQGGIEATTWHFMIQSNPRFRGVSSADKGPGHANSGHANECEKLGSSICAATGVLSNEHRLVSFRDSGEDITHSIAYKNTPSLMRALVVPEFEFQQRTVLGGNQVNLAPSFPRVMALSLQMKGVETPRSFFNTSVQMGPRASRPFSLGQRLDIRGLKSGLYRVQSKIELINGTVDNPSARMRSDEFYLPVISPQSDFGLGQKLRSLQRIYGIDGKLAFGDQKLMLVYGNHQHMVFERGTVEPVPQFKNYTRAHYTPPVGDQKTAKFWAIEIDGDVYGYVRDFKGGERHIFDDSGRLVQTSDRYRRLHDYLYNESGQLKTIVHTTMGSHSLDHEDRRQTHFAYGNDGLIDTITDPHRRVTRFEHDSQRNLTRITDPDGSSVGFAYAPDHALLSRADKLGRVTSYSYDSKGNVTAVVHPDNSVMNLRSRQTQLLGEDGRGSMANPYTIGEVAGVNGNVITDSRGNEVNLQTNEYGAITRRMDAMGGVQSVERDSHNNVTSITDERGNRREFDYDQFGNLLAMRDFQSGRTEPRQVQLEYLANPQDNFHLPMAVVDAKGVRTTFEYNKLGNIIRENRLPPHGLYTIHYEYGHFGKIKSFKTRYLKDSIGGYYQYDFDGNLLELRNAYREVVMRYTYDSRGNVLTQTDLDSNTTSYTYDIMSRLLTQTNPDGGVVRYTYDLENNLLSIQDPGDNTTRFAYNARNRMISRTDPLGKTETFSYDGNGNLASRTDRKEQRISFSYDALNRLVGRHYPDSSGVKFTYDAAWNVATASNAHAKLMFDYDGRNRIVTASSDKGPILDYTEIRYQYDDNDNVLSIWDSETGNRHGRVIYDYDKRNRVVEVRHPPGLFSPGGRSVVRYKYDIHNRVKEMFFGNGVKGKLTYVPSRFNQLWKIIYTRRGEDVSSFFYDHDQFDRVTQLRSVRGGISVNTRSYTYDQNDQMISATQPLGRGIETFSYNSTGNRLRRDGESADALFNTNNQLLQDSRFLYVYDGNGNLTTKTHRTTGQVMEFSWDYDNRLVGITTRPNTGGAASNVVVYRYDPFGRRIEKEINGKATRYLYDRGRILLEYKKSYYGRNYFKARYVYGPKADEILKVDRIEGAYYDKTFAHNEFYYQRDNLGNVTEVSNFLGAVVQRYVYDAYGNPTVYDHGERQITPSSENFLINPFMFASREYDTESGHYFNINRYYDPQVGRFLSPDPIGRVLGEDVNVYRYAYNNPINYTDPLGLRVIFFSLGRSSTLGKPFAKYLGQKIPNTTMTIKNDPAGTESKDVGLAFDFSSFSFRLFSNKTVKTQTSSGWFAGIGLTGGYLNGTFDDFFGKGIERSSHIGLDPLRLIHPPLVVTTAGASYIETATGKVGGTIDFPFLGYGGGAAYTVRETITCPIKFSELIDFFASP